MHSVTIVAIAAPIIPRVGIREKFKIIFAAAPIPEAIVLFFC